MAAIRVSNDLDGNETYAEEGNDGDGTGVVMITGKFMLGLAA